MGMFWMTGYQPETKRIVSKQDETGMAFSTMKLQKSGIVDLGPPASLLWFHPENNVWDSNGKPNL